MKQSDQINEIAAALLAAQREIKNAPKTATNPHFKNTYVPLDEMIPVVKAALNAHGIVFVQGAEESNGDVLNLNTLLLHTSGQWIESTLTMRPARNDPQGIGSCITYARRYSLAAMCGVASEDDDDANAASAAPEQKSVSAKTDKKHEAALELFRQAWAKFPDKTIPKCALFLPLVTEWGDIKNQSTAALLEAVDKINIALAEMEERA